MVLKNKKLNLRKMKLKFLQITFTIFCMLCVNSCTFGGGGSTYYREINFYAYVSLNIYKGGYWGNWSRDESLRWIVKQTSKGTEITYYSEYASHPSDFDYKIIIYNDSEYDSGEILDDGWRKFYGEITIKKDKESGMVDYYTTPKTGSEALKKYWTFPCTIKRKLEPFSPTGNYNYSIWTQNGRGDVDYSLKYVYNIWYNGVARAFDISYIESYYSRPY